MIKKYIFGSPIETNAVVQDINAENFDEKNNKLDIFDINIADDKLSLSVEIGKNDIVYGLGETTRGINKRGWTYRSFCNDDPCHTEEKQSLYGAHNFIIISGSINLGLFLDSSSEMFFDIGYSEYDRITITASANNLIIYIINNDSAATITKDFRHLIGQSYVPPYWAFGFQQSKWSYMSSDAVRTVSKNYRENNIPIDSINLDIDYMDSFKDFTINSENFGDFEVLVNDLKDTNIHLIPIIDAGVKIEDGYNVYEEGVKDNHFCKDEDGKEFVVGVWPGRTHFPDFFKADTRKWFGDKYSYLVDKGIEGFWNDMNEPAMFYTEKGLNKTFKFLEECKDKQLSLYEYFSMKDSVLWLSNNSDDYKSFYHEIDGKNVCHYDVHNLYGYNMTRAAADSLNQNYPDKRFLLYSRASYIGMHRCSGIWTGDNQSWWSHILLSLKMMPSLNMCGFLYTGSDIGGFGCNATEDLVLRWLAFGLFTPLMRNHSALGTRNQEAYSFSKTDDFRNIINLRYSLIPHLYSEYMKAVLDDSMYFKPLAFDYPDDKYAKHVEDQLLLGDSLMIAPVYEQNAIGRYVYLPEDMLLAKYMSDGSFYFSIMEKGHHFIDVALNEVPLFIRPGKLIAFCKPALSTAEIDTSDIQLIGYIKSGTEVEYKFYEDDGTTLNYSNSFINLLKVSRDNNGDVACEHNTLKKITLNIY